MATSPRRRSWTDSMPASTTSDPAVRRHRPRTMTVFAAAFAAGAVLAYGIDRVVMMMTNQQSIREVIFFPHMRPE